MDYANTDFTIIIYFITGSRCNKYSNCFLGKSKDLLPFLNKNRLIVLCRHDAWMGNEHTLPTTTSSGSRYVRAW